MVQDNFPIQGTRVLRLKRLNTLHNGLKHIIMKFTTLRGKRSPYLQEKMQFQVKGWESEWDWFSSYTGSQKARGAGPSTFSGALLTQKSYSAQYHQLCKRIKTFLHKNELLNTPLFRKLLDEDVAIWRNTPRKRKNGIQPRENESPDNGDSKMLPAQKT